MKAKHKLPLKRAKLKQKKPLKKPLKKLPLKKPLKKLPLKILWSQTTLQSLPARILPTSSKQSQHKHPFQKAPVRRGFFWFIVAC